jgi:hypothetical protein
VFLFALLLHSVDVTKAGFFERKGFICKNNIKPRSIHSIA